MTKGNSIGAHPDPQTLVSGDSHALSGWMRKVCDGWGSGEENSRRASDEPKR